MGYGGNKKSKNNSWYQNLRRVNLPSIREQLLFGDTAELKTLHGNLYSLSCFTGVTRDDQVVSQEFLFLGDGTLCSYIKTYTGLETTIVVDVQLDSMTHTLTINKSSTKTVFTRDVIAIRDSTLDFCKKLSSMNITSILELLDADSYNLRRLVKYTTTDMMLYHREEWKRFIITEDNLSSSEML